MSDKKVIQLEDRIPKLQELRRQKTNRRFVFYVTLFFILFLVVTYIESPLSNVKGITVSGNRYMPVKDIQAASGLTNRSKIWNINKKAVTKKLLQLPSIKKAEVTTHFFSGQVFLTVSEYKRVAYIKEGNAYREVMANGKFSKELLKNETPVNAPVLIGFKQGHALTALASQLDQIKPSMLYDLSEIVYTPTSLFPNGITLYLNDGHTALADSTTLAKKLAMYPSILANLPSNQDGVVQLRVGAYWSPNPANSGKSNSSDTGASTNSSNTSVSTAANTNGGT